MKEEINKVYGNKVRIRVSGICMQENSILLINHIGIGEKGSLWAPPGGGLEYEETLEACLIREFKEETGLEIEVTNFLFLNEFIAPPLHAIELFYEIFILSGTLKIGTDPEMKKDKQLLSELKFWNFEDLKKEDPTLFHTRILEMNPIYGK